MMRFILDYLNKHHIATIDKVKSKQTVSTLTTLVNKKFNTYYSEGEIETLAVYLFL